MTSCVRNIIKMLLILLIVLLLPIYANAATDFTSGENPVRVRVAFPEIAGISETKEDGSKSGIFYDYLREISKYTGWEYEYISGDVDTLIAKAENNEIDLIGGIYQLEKHSDSFYFPEYDMGYKYALLFSRKDDDSINNCDWRTLNNKTIGVYTAEADKIKELKYFLSYNNIPYKLKEYKSQEKFRKALQQKEIDVMLGSDFYIKKQYNVVAKFKVQPQYIVTNKKNVKLGQELSEALKKIYEADANFDEKLYYKYFPEKYQNTIIFSDDEEAYIRNSKAIKVVLVEDFYPFNYNGNKMENGIVRRMFSLLTEKTGLKFEYVYAPNYMEAIRFVKDGKAEILGSFLDDETVAEKDGLIITQKYANLDEVIIKNKKIDFPSDAKTIAVLKGRKISSLIDGKTIRYYETYKECINAINRGEADYAMLLSHLVESVMEENHFRQTTYVGVNCGKREISIALKKGVDVRLYSILNKVVNNLTKEEQESILSQCLISSGTKKITLKSIMYSNPIIFIKVIFIICIFFMAVILVITKLELKSKIMKAELVKAEEANREKADFLSKMSHEIRTPMNAIIGLTNLARMSGESTATIENYLNKIEASSKFLLALVNDVLDMSKMEKKKMNIVLEPFDLKNLETELENMVYFQAQERNIEIIFDYEIEHSIVVGDPIRIKQVLMNLLSNALKFTREEGFVHLVIKEKMSSEERIIVGFSVEDNGIGIKKEDLERIFDSFEQGSVTVQNSQGTGLGLAISSGLVKLMGGELKVTSQFGVGTRFYFDLALQVGRLEKKEELCESETEEYNLFSGMKILLAEDNDLNAEIVISLLDMQGAIVERAENGKVAVQMFYEKEEFYYDAILMDIQMPVMNGITACEKIRSSNRADGKKIPVITMTANTFDDDRNRATEAGMNAFVPKPFEVEKMYEVLKKSFSEH